MNQARRPAVVVGFDGGLGNQMFQYAAGRALALRSDAGLLLDTSHYHSGSDRRFGLDAFTIAGRRLSLMERHRYGLDRYVAGTRDAPPPSGIAVLAQKNLNLPVAIPHRVRRSLYLNGSWQHPLYFKSHMEEIRRDFTLKSPSDELKAAIAALSQVPAVAVHVRRTDFFKGHLVDIFGLCSMDYFARGMALIREREPEAVFHVFSDDIRWTAANLPIEGPHVFLPGNLADPVEDLVLMSNCRHFVISNSTFSWWGAFLGAHPGKIVVSPTHWFVTGTPWEPMLPDWIRLPP